MWRKKTRVRDNYLYKKIQANNLKDFCTKKITILIIYTANENESFF